MGQITQRALQKVSGPAWNQLRLQFNEVADTLLSVDASAFADITTIYIKFTVSDDPMSPVYAVMWVKSSKRLVVGLALPESDLPDELSEAPQGMVYKGLTGYFTVEPGNVVPTCLKSWARTAFNFVAG